MTTAQLDHLRAIDAHLAKLLDIAAKRTPGEWDNENGPYVYAHIEGGRSNGEYIMQVYCGNGAGKPLSRSQNTFNAAFIASCAGNAEAGWRATRAAIKGLLAIEASDTCADEAHACNHPSDAADILEAILAAFPLELLEA